MTRDQSGDDCLDDDIDQLLLDRASKTILSGLEIKVDWSVMGMDGPEGDMSAMLWALLGTSYEVYDLWEVAGFADPDDIRPRAAFLDELRVALSREEGLDDVPIYVVLDTAQGRDSEHRVLPAKKFDRTGSGLTKDEMFHWGELFSSGALLCVDRAVQYIHQDRPHKAAFLLYEAQMLLMEAKFALNSPFRLHAMIAGQTKIDRRNQDLTWLWNHFRSSPEYKRSGAGEYKPAAARLLRKMQEQYPERKNLPALTMVERHFREKLREKDGVQFRRGAPPKRALKKSPLRAAE